MRKVIYDHITDTGTLGKNSVHYILHKGNIDDFRGNVIKHGLCK
jgi:hypothetical protein